MRMAAWANPNPNSNPHPYPNQVTFVDGGMGYKLGRTENDLVVGVPPIVVCTREEPNKVLGLPAHGSAFCT